MNNTNWLNRSIRLVLSLVIIFLVFWFTLPPLNIKSQSFWSFVFTSVIIFVVINAFGKLITSINHIKDYGFKSFKDSSKGDLKRAGKTLVFSVGFIAIAVLLSIVMNLIGAQFFNANNYHNLITLKDGNFTKDVAELKMSQVPVADRESSIALGQRKLGEMTQLVSQFVIADNYTQINYQEKPFRVTPLAYSDPIKWFNNQKSGIPAYITVDMSSQETTLVQIEQGIKYSESEYFMRNIHRYLRFKYPTKIFDEISFEIDDNGTPFWVASTVKFRIGFWNGKDIEGAVLVNAVTGESSYQKFEEIPDWVDQVCDASMIIEQLTYNGKYRSGFWNSIVGQNGVIQPTDGYNYLSINDDIWLYTGMTSVVSDQSNVGFVLVNLRTKESKYYEMPSAEEHSAMRSAEGSVQEKRYKSTFPLLLNVADRPTYFMSLKDEAGLVKMFAFVDVEQYNIVGTGSSVAKARENYVTGLSDEDLVSDVVVNPDTFTLVSDVELINSAVIDGNTKYFIKLKDNAKIFVLDISLSNELPFIKESTKVELVYSIEDSKEVVKSIKIVNQ